MRIDCNNFKKINRVLIALFLLCYLSACSSLDTDEPTKKNKYIVDVLSEKTITKEELAKIIAKALNKEGDKLLESFFISLCCDVQIASINYTTTGVDGEKTIASGVVAYPTGTQSYDHLLSIQHGTLDIDEAPSINRFHIELIPVIRGHVVLMADYLGYGSSKTADLQHPYLHNKLTGSTCADMIEATREYLFAKNITEEKDELELMGYSQGGQASIATQMEIERRGQGSRIKAVHAGGAPCDLESIAQSFYEIIQTGKPYYRTGFLPYLIRGMIYGEGLKVQEKNIYAPELMEKGLNKLFSTSNLSLWHTAIGTDLSKVVHPNFFLPPPYGGNADIATIYAALKKNSLVNAAQKPQSPLFLYHSRMDDFVPYTNAVSAHKQWQGSTLTDLSMPGHMNAGFEFIIRYMDMWDLMKGFFLNDEKK